MSPNLIESLNPVIARLGTNRSRNRLFSSWNLGIARKRSPDIAATPRKRTIADTTRRQSETCRSLRNRRPQSACEAHGGTTPRTARTGAWPPSVEAAIVITRRNAERPRGEEEDLAGEEERDREDPGDHDQEEAQDHDLQVVAAGAVADPPVQQQQEIQPHDRRQDLPRAPEVRREEGEDGREREAVHPGGDARGKSGPGQRRDDSRRREDRHPLRSRCPGRTPSLSTAA